MKKYKILVTLIILVGTTLLVIANPVNEIHETLNLINQTDTQPKKLRICIDPGHQKKGDSSLEFIAPNSSQQKARVSSGATGIATKKPEYILNLEVSFILKEMLQDKGYEVIMTREVHDINISNSERAIIGNKNSDIAIRIHADSLNDSSKTGASILIPSQYGRYTQNIYPKSNILANEVKESMIQNGIQINGIFERDDLTGFNWSQIPVILVEMGFLSNYNEDMMMSDLNYQKKLMKSIVEGLENYEAKNRESIRKSFNSDL